MAFVQSSFRGRVLSFSLIALGCASFAIAEGEYVGAAIPVGEAALCAAESQHQGQDFIEVTGAVVSDALPDDLSGSRHEKWVVRLACGVDVQAVYNIDVTPRIPIKTGDVISMGGQFIYDRGGGLMHWLHEDGHGHRPNGYVEINNVRYGANDPSGIYK